jgi:hypothetical protein
MCDEPNKEEVKVAAWRIGQLCRAGFEPEWAGAIAATKTEYQEAIRMLKAGLPQSLIAHLLVD